MASSANNPNSGRSGDSVKLIPFQRVRKEPDMAPGTGATGITPDSNFRKIIGCGSLNYHMLDENEKRMVLDVWCEFLDNLDFPIQILSHSKQLDPEAYIRQFEHRLANPRLSPALRAMIEDHVRHQRRRVVEGKLLNREFYIVVPYGGVDKTVLEPMSDYIPTLGFANTVMGKFDRDEYKEIDVTLFDDAEIVLNRRVNFVRGYLERMRIPSHHPLNMTEMRNLFFEFFHPQRSEEYRLQIDDWGGEIFPMVDDDGF